MVRVPTVDGMTLATGPSLSGSPPPSLSGSIPTAGPAPAAEPPRPTWRSRLGSDTAYLLTGLPLAIAGFVVGVLTIAAGFGNLAVVIGFPILAAGLRAVRVLADVERDRIARVLWVPRVRPAYRSAAPGAGAWRRWFATIGDAQSWLDLLYAIVAFPVSVLAFCLTAVWWAGAIGGLCYWAYDWALPHGPASRELHEMLGLADTAGNRLLLYVGLGMVFALTLPFMLRGVALARASVSRALLTGLAEVAARITGLRAAAATAQAQTAAAVSAEAIALRRLERDIHDGPQQRLVRLALDLGRAQRQLDSNPAAARDTMTEALTQAREALDELRALSRGIAPPILADRGLPAALAALAGRSPVPVELDTAELGRLDPAAENAAYFVVAEALTNVAKHSRARQCQVALRRTADRIVVTVTDDGFGGAQLAKGHGLTGLADRVQAAGGMLTVTSPTGGPTTITAELPCR